ncbi:MAG: helix-turn-helix domain-containing protein [Clostridia bacterium]|nr:helix-turn-helix domain-containing protein [Clostridia bacterium]
MNSFSEELLSARKAKNMTQEQLAAALNVTRSTVSHWENGRNEPDLETLQKISLLLETTFSVQVTPAAEAAPAADREQLVRKNKLLKIMAAIIALLLIVIVVLIACGILPTGSKPVNEPAASADAAPLAVTPIMPPKAETIEWYSSACLPTEGMPFVMIQFNENPLRAINNADLFPDGPGWFYTTYLTETNGKPFTITHLRLVNFMDIKNDIFDYDGDTVSGWFGSSTLPPREQFAFNGGFPMVPEIKGIGFCLTGRAEDGTEMEFHAYLPLLQEVAE